MLRGIRRLSTTWLGRILMGAVMTLLAGIFAIWGINDIFRGYGSTTIAKIGSTEIPTELFRRNYNDRLQQLGQQLRRPITPDQAKAFGLDRQVLKEMMIQAGLDERARQMRLGLSDAEIARRITNDPHFQTPTGQFNSALFQNALANVGYTEQRYVAEQRRGLLRRQIIDSISGSVQAPKAWLDAIGQYQGEERSIAYLALRPAQAGDVPPPTDEQLSKYFDERKIMFRAPEYRKIVTVAVTPADLAKTVEVPDDTVKQIFDANPARYIRPERRHVERMVFPSLAEAQAASDRIKNGTSFAAIAAERGIKEADLDLGTVTKTTIVDPAVADAAFSLKVGEVSAAVPSGSGAVIVTVTEIEPGENKTFADVAPQIRNEIALAQTKKLVQDVHDKMEDERAGGATVQEAAEKLKLPVVTVDAVDRSGHDPAGKPVADLPDAAQVVAAAFASDVGVDNDPLEADGGYIWYDVASITASRERTLDEVKDQVAARWRDDEIASRLKAKAADILDKLKGGTPMEALATANGVKVQTASGIRRGQPAPTIAAPMIEQIFHTAKDGVASAEGDKPSDWIVFRVTDVKTPPLDPNSAAAKQIGQQIASEISDDLFNQYMASLETELGISINMAAVEQATGSGGAPDTN
jgi:peptidyl-prolyl cis-trans isomerase D